MSTKAFTLVLSMLTEITASERLLGAAAAAKVERRGTQLSVADAKLSLDCLLDWHTFWKCPFLPHPLHRACKAGHFARGWRLYPQKKHLLLPLALDMEAHAWSSQQSDLDWSATAGTSMSGSVFRPFPVIWQDQKLL